MLNPSLVDMLYALLGCVGLVLLAATLFYTCVWLIGELRDRAGRSARERRQVWQREGQDSIIYRLNDAADWFSGHPDVHALLHDLIRGVDVDVARADYVRRTHRSKLYYEAHVTIDPVEGDRLLQFKDLCARHQFHVADLVMVKPGIGDAPSTRDSFCTSRHIERDVIRERTKALVCALLENGYRVRRYKIEDTVLDSRTSDEFGLLPPVTVEITVDTSDFTKKVDVAVAAMKDIEASLHQQVS